MSPALRKWREAGGSIINSRSLLAAWRTWGEAWEHEIREQEEGWGGMSTELKGLENNRIIQSFPYLNEKKEEREGGEEKGDGGKEGRGNRRKAGEA